MTNSKTKFTGIILAGGKSQRMGQNKALMLLNGKRIIEYVYEMFDSFCDEIILSTNSPKEYDFLPVKKQKDLYQNIGPIAGLHAGLKASCNEINFICSCDTPFVSREMFIFLHENAKNYDIVTPAHNGITEPIIGLFRKKTFLDFEKSIENKLYSPPKVERTCQQLIIEISAQSKFYKEELFTNINTKEEFLNLANIKKENMTIKLLIFGILTDIMDTNSLSLENIDSVSELKKKLFSDYPNLKGQNFKISVNKKFVNDNLKLNNNDEVALLPPFTGG